MSKVASSSVAAPSSIPNYAKKIVQSIREIVGKQHTDDDIYSVLQECNMDPNDTAQKLLYLGCSEANIIWLTDTFHEVKSKRDRRKESSAQATHGRGARGGQGFNFSNFSTSDTGSGRNGAPRRENGVNHVRERDSVLPLSVSKQTKNNAMTRMPKTSVAIRNGPSSLANASFSPDGSVAAVDGKKLETVPLLPTVAEQSAPAPAQSFSSIVRNEREKSTSVPNHYPSSNAPAPVSGVYSSASDPVLVPSLSRNPGSVGTIKREVGIQQKAFEPNNFQENKYVAHDGVSELPESEQAASGTSDPTNKEVAPEESKEDEKNQQLEPLESSSSGFSAVESSHDVVVASKVVTSEASPVSDKASCQSVPESNVRDGQHVTFPNHFQVPEEIKNGLTFGSFEANFGVGINHANGTGGDMNSHSVESSQGSDETFGEPSPSDQTVSSIVQGDNPDHPQSTSLGLENVPSSHDNLPTGADLKSDQSKPEMLLLPEGTQNPTLQNVSSYRFGFMSALPGSQLVQFEGPETQNANQQVSSSASQSPAGQSSTSTSPQPVLFRQPFPPNYFPYTQYLPPFYMSPIHHFISPNGLPQQPSSGNVYLPPAAAAAAASGVKFPLPPFKLGTNSGNPPHMGIPSGYGSYTSSPVGFNPVSAMTSGSSAGNEDPLASQLKESHIYTTGPMSEGSPLWIPTPSQDLSRMQVSSLYNLPLQGQHLAFSPQQAGHGAFAGIYQTAQSMAAPSNANPLLQQSQAMAAAAETVVRPSNGAFQQPQLAQMNWTPNY